MVSIGEGTLSLLTRLALATILFTGFFGARAEVADFEFRSFFATGSAGSITIDGTFTGEIVDGRISNITNAHLFRDGKAFRGNGALYTLQYDFQLKQYVSGGYVSLDGSDNNILFIDSDFASGDAGFYNYFYSITGIGNSAFQPSFYRYLVPETRQMTVDFEDDGMVPPPPGGGNAGAVPEPGIWAMLILGFGAVGGAQRRSFGRRDSRRATMVAKRLPM